MFELLSGGRKAKPLDPTDLIGFYQDPNDASRYSGYYGEVASADFITASELVTKVGLAMNSVVTGADTAGWLKFLLDGKTLYVAKKPLRNTTWSFLSNNGLYNGTKKVTIGNKQYIVRILSLLKVSGGAHPGSGVDDPLASQGSEWNRLMYNIWGEYTPASQQGGKWANFVSADLGVSTITLGKETVISAGTTYYAIKNVGSAAFQRIGANGSTSAGGWRPVLELIP